MTSGLSTNASIAAIAAAVAAIVSPLVQPAPQDRDIQAVEDVSRPHPNNLVFLHQDSQLSPVVYTVPMGKQLILTGTNTNGSGSLRIDGGPWQTFWGQGFSSLGNGVLVQEGQQITMSSGSYDWSLFGHLTNL